MPNRHKHRASPRTAERAGPPGPPPRGGGGASPFRKPDRDLVVLWGIHAVREALRAGRRKVLDLYATEAAAGRLEPDLAAAGLQARLVDAQALDRRLGPNAVHQGVLLEARPLPALDIADLAGPDRIVLVLDQITDPHNVGAILRSAAAFGVAGLVTTDRHAPPLDGVLAKAASGALEHVPVVTVPNLARALDELGAQGFWRVGLDSAGDVGLGAAIAPGSLALVLGAEGVGLRRLTRERCDVVARLDMPGPIKSLNVSNACAVALTLLRQRLTGF